jgi:hypothetical protein
MLQDVLQQNVLEGVGVQRPGGGLDVHQQVRRAGGEAVDVQPALAFVEPAAEIELQSAPPWTLEPLRRFAGGAKRA